MILGVSGKEKGGAELILDRTVFFPEGGGQSPDRGWIFVNGSGTGEALALPVTDVQISEIDPGRRRRADADRLGEKVRLYAEPHRRAYFVRAHAQPLWV